MGLPLLLVGAALKKELLLPLVASACAWWVQWPLGRCLSHLQAGCWCWGWGCPGVLLAGSMLPDPGSHYPRSSVTLGKIGLFFPETDRSWTSKAMACHGSCSLGMQFPNQSINSSVGLSVAFSCFGNMKPSVCYEFDFLLFVYLFEFVFFFFDNSVSQITTACWNIPVFNLRMRNLGVICAFGHITVAEKSTLVLWRCWLITDSGYQVITCTVVLLAGFVCVCVLNFTLVSTGNLHLLLALLDFDIVSKKMSTGYELHGWGRLNSYCILLWLCIKRAFAQCGEK